MTRVDGRAPGAAPRPKRAPEPDRHLLEKGRALGTLAGLFLFAVGFAVAAVIEVIVTASTSTALGQPAYYIGIGGGLVGIGLVAYFSGRGTVPLPERTALWSPRGVRLLAASAGWPETLTLWALYAIGGWGLLGNILIPVVFSSIHGR